MNAELADKAGANTAALQNAIHVTADAKAENTDSKNEQAADAGGRAGLWSLISRPNLQQAAIILQSIIAGEKQHKLSGDNNEDRGDSTPSGQQTTHAASWIRAAKNGIDETEARLVANGIRESIAAIISAQQLEENQAELARISNLLPNYTMLFEDNRLRNLALAVSTLASEKPNTSFAASVRSDCELSILRSQRGLFRSVYRLAGSSSISATMSGLIFSALAACRT